MRIVLAIVALALVLVVPAYADPAPPTVTLLAPADGSKLKLEADFKPVFGWRIAFTQAPTATTAITFSVSSDPSFQGWKYTEHYDCPPTNPACVTALVPRESDWIDQANGGAPLPESGTLTLYWRVTVTVGVGVETTANGYLVGVAVPPDTTPPRLAIRPAAAHRGALTNIWIHVEDNRDSTLLLGAQLSYRGEPLLVDSKVFTNVSWEDVYYFRFLVPKQAPVGRYRICVVAADTSLNTVERCSALNIR